VLVLTARVAPAILSLRTSQRKMQGSMRWAWSLLGLALSFWAAGEIVRSVAWLAGQWPPPTPSLGDLFRLAGSFAAIASLGSFPSAPPERFGRLRGLLDVVILTLAVLGLCWMIFVRPVLEIRMGSAVQVFWAASPAIFDLALGPLVLRLSLQDHDRRRRPVFRLLGLAVMLLAASDLVTGYLTLLGLQHPGTLVDAGWMAAGLLLVHADGRLGAALEAGSHHVGERSRRVASRLEPLLVVAFTYAVVGYVVLNWRFTERLDWAGLGVAIMLSLLLVARQGVIAGQVEMRQFAAVVNASTDLTFICEADGRIRFANPALRRAVGGGRRDPGNLEEVLARDVPVAQLLSEGLMEGWSGEVSFRRQDGTAFPVSLSLTPVQDERRSKPMLVGTANDLTNIKEREIELGSALAEVAAARKELESLNQALEKKVEERTRELEGTVADLARLNEDLKALDRLKSEFVTLVSHELRAPLTNIRSGVELILDGYPDLGGKVLDTLRLVGGETERLARFVEAILDLSALEAGRFPLHLAPLSVEAVAHTACRRFPDFAGGRVRITCPAHLPDVMADERALMSVFYHLLDNARKYAPDGEILVEASPEGEMVRVSVSDAGPGIPAAERERVFEMFHRLDARDSREVYGHGLGLHLAHRMLAAMGGGIEAGMSALGGARLTFWLPKAE
jgi:PAS domain S-box-containing protein